MKYDGIQQDEYLLNSNMLGVKTSDELKRLGKVAFLNYFFNCFFKK